MTEPLIQTLAQVRGLLLDDGALVRAVASGRRRGEHPAFGKVELRYVDLTAGRRLQVTTYDATQAHTVNHPSGVAAAAAVDRVLAEPFAHWHVDTTEETWQVRVSKRGEALVHRQARTAPAGPDRRHDRAKARLLAEDDPVLVALGISDRHGRVKPSRQNKYRQVEEFLRQLDASIRDALDQGHLRRPTPEQPLQVVDLGCGNAYLTFAAERFLRHVKGLPVAFTGVDVKQRSAAHNGEVAARVGVQAAFIAAAIDQVELAATPDVVLALHACDTATDDALARAVRWQTPLVLAAPCCHHDVAAQLRLGAAPAPYSLLTRHGILRERFADTLTDALRAALLRRHGYRVEVVEFVESKHTPRNTLLRAVRTGVPAAGSEYDDLVAAWGVHPRLGELLAAKSR